MRKRQPLLWCVQLCSTRTIPIRRRSDVRNSICRRARPAWQDGSLHQLPQKGSRRLFARLCASGCRHYRRAAAMSYRGGGRRPRHRLRFAPALRAEIQMGSGMQQSYTPLHLYSPILRPCRRPNGSSAARPAAARATSACFDVVGSPIPPTPVCFTHTDPTHRQKAGSSWIANAIGALLRVGTNRFPSQCPCRHGLRQRRQLHRSGPLMFCQARSRRYDMPPSHGVGRFVRPCGGSAGLAAPTPSAPPHRLTFRAVSIERTTLSMSQRGSLGEPTRRVCRYGFANSVNRTSSAHFSCGAVGLRAAWVAAYAVGLHVACVVVFFTMGHRFAMGCGCAYPSVRRCAGRAAVACGKRLTSRPSATASPWGAA